MKLPSQSRTIDRVLRLALVAGALVPVLLAAPASAAEPWADPQLTLTAGLSAWYDASAEPAARKAAGKKAWKDDSRVDLWHDASGAGRHLRQPVKADRPVIRFAEQLAFVHFDGENDVLFADGLNLPLGEFTVFVVGTPFSNDGGFRAFLSANRDGQNDYVSGLNIDQGPDGSRKFVTINVEGPGFGGRAISSSPKRLSASLCACAWRRPLVPRQRLSTSMANRPLGEIE